MITIFLRSLDTSVFFGIFTKNANIFHHSNLDKGVVVVVVVVIVVVVEVVVIVVLVG